MKDNETAGLPAVMEGNQFIVGNFDSLARLAKSFAAGRMCGISTPEEAMTLIVTAVAENRPLGAVATEYHVINGKATLKASAVQARFQLAGGKIRWTKSDDKECEAVFSHPAGGEITIRWDMGRAKAAGLLKNPTWAKYPAQMLRARTVAEGVRACYPAVLQGLYLEEEAKDIAADESAKPAPTARKAQPKPQAQPQPAKAAAQDAEIVETAEAMLKRLGAEDPEAARELCKELRERGWAKLSQIPESELPFVENLFWEIHGQMKHSSEEEA